MERDTDNLLVIGDLILSMFKQIIRATASIARKHNYQIVGLINHHCFYARGSKTHNNRSVLFSRPHERRLRTKKRILPSVVDENEGVVGDIFRPRQCSNEHGRVFPMPSSEVVYN